VLEISESRTDVMKFSDYCFVLYLCCLKKKILKAINLTKVLVEIFDTQETKYILNLEIFTLFKFFMHFGS
jgi:hypothetical protein